MASIKPATNLTVITPARAKTGKASGIPAVPDGLSAAACDWWSRLHGDFDLSDAGALFTLEVALRAFDRMNEAAGLIAEHGVAILDKYGQLKPNPACSVERDCRSAMMAAMKSLGLDVLPAQPPGRPAGRCRSRTWPQ